MVSRTVRQALLVEENPEIAAELNAILTDMGYKVTTLDNPEEVTSTLGNHQYEVALLNMQLPDMSWRGTFNAIKSASRSTTVIMMSQNADEEDKRTALTAGAYVTLERPLDGSRVAHLISPKNDGMFVSLRN